MKRLAVARLRLPGSEAWLERQVVEAEGRQWRVYPLKEELPACPWFNEALTLDEALRRLDAAAPNP